MNVARLLKDNMLFIGIVVVVIIIAVTVMKKKKEKYYDYETTAHGNYTVTQQKTHPFWGWGGNKGLRCKNSDNTGCLTVKRLRWREPYPFWGWGPNEGMRCKNNDNTGCDTTYGYTRPPRPAPKPAPRPAPKPAPRPAPKPAPRPADGGLYKRGVIYDISGDRKTFSFNVPGFASRTFTFKAPRWDLKIGQHMRVWIPRN